MKRIRQIPEATAYKLLALQKSVEAAQHKLALARLELDVHNKQWTDALAAAGVPAGHALVVNETPHSSGAVLKVGTVLDPSGNVVLEDVPEEEPVTVPSNGEGPKHLLG